MKIFRNLFAFIVILIVAGVSTIAQSKSVTIFDSYNAWPGYSADGKGDEYGSPEISSIAFNYDEDKRLLQKVILNFEFGATQSIRWDSLFINTSYVSLEGVTSTNWDQTWDYFVHTNSTNGGDGVDWGSTANINGTIPTEGLYKVAPKFATDKYTTVKSTGRVGHPDGIDANVLTSIDGTIKGVLAETSSNYYTITYNFTTLSDGGIKFSDGFVVGYTPWCANDVILASVSEPVPEPATMLLFGSGLIGFAGFRRIRSKMGSIR